MSINRIYYNPIIKMVGLIFLYNSFTLNYYKLFLYLIAQNKDILSKLIYLIKFMIYYIKITNVKNF